MKTPNTQAHVRLSFHAHPRQRNGGEGERGRGKSRRIGGEMQTGISVGSRMRGRGTVREGERRGEAMSE